MDDPAAGGTNRYAPPGAVVGDVDAVGPAGALAERGTRLGGALIDVGISLLAFGAIALLTPYNIFTTASQPGAGLVSTVVVPYLLGFGLFVLIHGWLLVTRGQTVGKALLKMRIVRSDGSTVMPGRLLGLRYALPSLVTSIPIVGQIFGLVDALMIFRDSRKTLHDQIADTVVVKV